MPCLCHCEKCKQVLWVTSPVATNQAFSTGVCVINVVYLSAILPEEGVKILRISQPFLLTDDSVSLVPFSGVQQSSVSMSNQPVVPLSVVNVGIINECLKDCLVLCHENLRLGATVDMQSLVNVILI